MFWTYVTYIQTYISVSLSPVRPLYLMDMHALFTNENRDMAIAMSSSRADPVHGLNIPSSCPGWGYLNI